MVPKDILVVGTVVAALDPDTTERKVVGLKLAATPIGSEARFYHML